MSAVFPQITDAKVQAKDFMNQSDAQLALYHLQNLPYVIVSDESAGGASDSTTNDYIFVAPCKGEILKADFWKTVVNTGTGNTPVVKLVNGSNVVGETAAIALSGAIGDVHALTLDSAKVSFAAGDKLVFRIVTPASTVSAALKGKLQFIWKPVA